MAADLVRMFLADWRSQGRAVSPPADLPRRRGLGVGMPVTAREVPDRVA